MKLVRPCAPFQMIEPQGEALTIDTSGKVLVLPTGNPDLLASFNEYTLNSNRLTIAESPFGGLKGSTPPDYAPGTLYTPTDGVYLTDTSGTNSTKTLTAGKLKELGLLTVDTVVHSITEEFIIANTSESNNPTVIDDCSATTGWGVSYGTGVLSIENGRLKLVGTSDTSGRLLVTRAISLNLTNYFFVSAKIEINASKNTYFRFTDSNSKLLEFSGARFSVTANTNTCFVYPIKAPAGTVGSNPITLNSGFSYSSIVSFVVGSVSLTPSTEYTIYIDDIKADTYKPAYVELQVPDYLTDTSLSLQCWSGSVYYTAWIAKLDTVFAQVYSDSSKMIYSDGTLLNDCYGVTTYWRLLYPKGSAGQTAINSVGSITYSQNKGTKNRVGLMVWFPPSDGGRTNFNKIRLKSILSYTDINGNTIPRLCTSGSSGIITGSVIKRNDYYLFDGAGTINTPIILGDNFELEFDIEISAYKPTGQWHMLCGAAASGAFGFGIRVNTGEIRATKLSLVDAPISGYTMPLNTRQKIGCRYNKPTLEYTINGVVVSTVQFDQTFLQSPVYLCNYSTWGFAGKLYGAKIYVNSQKILEFMPTVKNMGSTTYQFEDSTNASYGLQNGFKDSGGKPRPFIALFDPASHEADFYLFTHKPKNLEFKRDESGNIHELKLYPGNGLIYWGRIHYSDLTLDSNSDLIPNCLETSIEGSITKFLQSYGVVI